MRKLMIASIVVLAAQAQARDTFDGCGLGWDVTDEKTMIATTTRGTTNYFVPPTFGMTSGTLGCDTFDGFAAVERDQLEYVAQNFETLRGELAVGSGDYVNAVAKGFDCEPSTFSQHIQQNYNSVVLPAQNGVELFENLKSEAGAVCS